MRRLALFEKRANCKTFPVGALLSWLKKNRRIPYGF
jgi:hypothetical protein